MEIGARKGSYKGMAADRDLSLVLGGLNRKPTATLGGQALDCSYDADKKEATIKLPVQSASTAATVSVKF